jgi:hypothetical protein
MREAAIIIAVGRQRGASSLAMPRKAGGQLSGVVDLLTLSQSPRYTPHMSTTALARHVSSFYFYYWPTALWGCGLSGMRSA